LTRWLGHDHGAIGEKCRAAAGQFHHNCIGQTSLQGHRDALAARREGTQMGRIPDPRIRHVLREIPAGAAVLDVGCVEHDADSAQLSGWLHRFPYRKAGSVLGIDIEETQVRRL